MKKSIIGAVLAIMCVGTVFAVTKVKPKACATNSGSSASKNYKEKTKTYKDRDKNNKDKNNKDKNNKDKNNKDKNNTCPNNKPSTDEGTTEDVINKDGLELVKPGESTETGAGTGDEGDTGANKDGLELVKPGESTGDSSGDSTGGCNQDSKPSVDVGNTSEDKCMNYKKGSVSHVCYLYIDKYGNVKYESKDDDAGNKTSVKLPCKKGYTLAVFVKQSTSGMIWFQNKVSDDIVNKVVNEIKRCDKSYKKHEAVAFGNGEHKLSYTTNGGKKQTVCYSFCK